jgi:phenol hydroxylase P0 protein
MTERASAHASPPFDPERRYVRLKQVRDDGFVEFEFGVGDPDDEAALAVELILPATAYREFCRDQQVAQVTPLQPAAADRESA